MTQLLHAEDERAAGELLYELGCTDGLPVVVPTPERVAEMCAAVAFPPDAVLGVVPPRQGVASVVSVAASAVMAGCRPEHFGVVCAAVKAVCDPAFTLGVVQVTTHNAAVLLIVNGPVRVSEPALESSTGALGPGNRGNATIGRALRLVLVNAGGGVAGVADMSTLGQPAKFTCCLAEAEEGAPFEPLATSRGVRASQSAVTALAVEGPRQVMFVPVGDAPGADADRLLALLAATVASPGALGGMGYRGSSAIVLSPLHAQLLADAGHDRSSICREVYDRACIPPEQIAWYHGFVRGASDGVHHGDVRALSSPEHLLVAVAGGPGTYTAVFCGLADGIGAAVTVEV